MKFNLIDKENWSRKPYFDYYMNNIKCTYSMTANIEITDLLMQVKRNNIKLYPILIYMTSKIVNNHEELRTSFDEEGNLGYWESMSPSFTIFHKDDESFSNIWTEYSDDFKTFYNNCLQDIGKYSNVKKLLQKKISLKIPSLFLVFLGLVLQELILMFIQMENLHIFCL